MFIYELIALAVISIMVAYHFKPLQQLKDYLFFGKISLNKIKLFGFNKIINCPECFAFWSSLTYYLVQHFTLHTSFINALVVVCITVIIEKFFISLD